MNKFEFNKLCPFKWFVLENFPFIEADFDAITNYQLYCKVVEYLNKVIENNNAIGIQTENLTNAFIELQDYVNNYFDNLDVQDEINNKLDDMVESGTLQEIIADYLNSKAIFGFNNVNEMKNATNLIDGSYAQTLGYYSKNDGGKALYKIRTITNDDIVDNSFIISLNNNNLVAELIIDNVINVKQIGAKGDGIADDTGILKKAINYFHVGTDEINQNYATVLINNFPKAGGTIYFPKGIYCIKETLSIPCYVDIDLGFSTLKAMANSTFIKDFMLSINSPDAEHWTYAYVSRRGFIKNGKIDGNNQNVKGICITDPHQIENIEFNKLITSIYYPPQIYVDNINIKECNFINSYDTEYQIIKRCQGENLNIENISFDVFNLSENPVKGLDLKAGNNGIIKNIINGIIHLHNTLDFTLENWHCENGYFIGEYNNNTIIKDSNIYVRNNTTPIKLISDPANNNLRTTILSNINFIYYLSLEQFNYDNKDIDISSYMGQIFVKACYRQLWLESIQAIANTGFLLYNGSSYLPVCYDECEIYNKEIIPKNSYIKMKNIFFGVSLNNYCNWNLPVGTYYYKIVNLADTERLIGSVSSEYNIQINNENTGVRLSINNNMGYGNIVRIYRGTSSNNYDSYVDIPNPKNSNLYDNGFSLNGFKWKNNTENIPTFSSILNIERHKTDSATLVSCIGYDIPSVGSWLKGDIIRRFNPASGGYIGWVCTESGNSGTWKGFGLIN